MREDLIERLQQRLNAERAVLSVGHNAADRERAELIRLLTEAAAALEAALEDACVSLVADIRFARGGGGKRMQPELVEFIRELAQDAERIDALEAIVMESDERALLLHHGLHEPRDQGFCGLGLGNTGGSLRAAIDQARGKGVGK